MYLHWQVSSLSLVLPGKPSSGFRTVQLQLFPSQTKNYAFEFYLWKILIPRKLLLFYPSVLVELIHIFASNFAYKFFHFTPSVCNYLLSGWNTFVIFSPAEVLLMKTSPVFHYLKATFSVLLLTVFFFSQDVTFYLLLLFSVLLRMSFYCLLATFIIIPIRKSMVTPICHSFEGTWLLFLCLWWTEKYTVIC